MQDAESESELKPVMYDSDAEVSYVYITHNNLYLLAITKSNCNAVALLTFLHRLIDIFKHYFKTLEEVIFHVLALSTRSVSCLRMLYVLPLFTPRKTNCTNMYLIVCDATERSQSVTTSS